MLTHNSAQSYTRPTAEIGVRRLLGKRSGQSILGSTRLWQVVGKFGLLLLLIVLTSQLAFNLYQSRVEQATSAAENLRHQLVDTHIALRAERAALLTPQHIEKIAGSMLSLHVPGEDQVSVYNKRKGRFERL